MSRKKEDLAGPTEEDWKRAHSLDPMLGSLRLSHPRDEKGSDY